MSACLLTHPPDGAGEEKQREKGRERGRRGERERSEVSMATHSPDGARRRSKDGKAERERELSMATHPPDGAGEEVLLGWGLVQTHGEATAGGWFRRMVRPQLVGVASDHGSHQDVFCPEASSNLTGCGASSLWKR